MDESLLDAVRNANREFQEFIDLASNNNAQGMATHVAVRQLEDVKHRLQQIAPFLSTQCRTADAAADEAFELLKYRENLKALRGAMQTILFSLLTEKARLENARNNTQAACAWATSLQEIS